MPWGNRPRSVMLDFAHFVLLFYYYCLLLFFLKHINMNNEMFQNSHLLHLKAIAWHHEKFEQICTAFWIGDLFFIFWEKNGHYVRWYVNNIWIELKWSNLQWLLGMSNVHVKGTTYNKLTYHDNNRQIHIQSLYRTCVTCVHIQYIHVHVQYRDLTTAQLYHVFIILYYLYWWECVLLITLL